MKLSLLLFASLLCFAEPPKTDASKVSVRGTLRQPKGKPPALELAAQKLIPLSGDEATMGVLKDQRLAGADFEVIGHFASPDLFVVDPIHTKAMFVHKNGKKLLITYWCSVCSIRTYTPGPCWCCQQETELDLREPGKE